MCIMCVFRVPPQAVGKNINSERLASSNSLTQAALRMFYGNVERLKVLMGNLFSAVHVHPSDATKRLSFSKCLTQYDLHQLLPLLKSSVIPGLLQCAYHVPSEWFDVELIEKFQLSETGDAPSDDSDGKVKNIKVAAPVEHLASKDASKANTGDV